MATRHTYASTDDLRDYLAGTTYASGWTVDSGTLRGILESQSRRIDDYCGGGTFGPVTETRYFDIGGGTLRHSSQYTKTGTAVGDIGITESLVNVVPLDGWLASATTVTAYGATDRSTSETLTEGYNGDYWLMPYNQTPKTIFELNEDTSKTLSGGQQTFAINGSWGYTTSTADVTTCDAISSTTATSISVSSATDLGPAQTILIDTEQIYITAISGNTLTVERGVSGTTAATHSAAATVARFEYPELVVQACKDLAKIVYRDRDIGRVDLIGSGEEQMTRGLEEAASVLSTISSYRVTGTSNGIIF